MARYERGGEFWEISVEAAARGLADPAKWRTLSHDARQARGLGPGSEGEYRVAGDLQSLRPSCTCPSRKRPCKHGLALLMLLADGKVPQA